MCKIRLSPQQEEIASLKEGTFLVRDSSGSAAKRVLVERVKMLSGITMSKVLVLTSTNKSCEEIKKGLKSIEENLMGHILVTTFYGLCESIFRSHKAHTRFNAMPQIFIDEDRKIILEETIAVNPSLSKWYSGLSDKERRETLYRALGDISYIKKSVILDDNIQDVIDDERICNLYLNYREQMASINAIDQDDLLYYAYQLLINNPTIAQLYRIAYEYICVDEAQYLNKAQYMVLRALTGGKHKNVMLLGDIHQSGYSFNGSNPKYMNEWFVKDYSPVISELTENDRSAKAIQDYVNTVIPVNSLDANTPYEGVCREKAYKTPWDEARGVVGVIKNLIGTEIEGYEGELGYSDIAVIARNKVILAKIEEELKTNSIPYYYKLASYGLGFTSNAGKAFDLAMIVRSNPDDRMHFDMLQSMFGVKNCHSFEQLLVRIEDNFMKEVVFKASQLQEDGSNVLQTIESIKEIIKTSDASTFKSIDEIIVTFDEFSWLEHHWNLYAQNIRRGSLSSFYNAIALGKTSANPGGSKGVTLSTVHNIKGQQAVVVFLIGMDEGIFPDYRAVEKGKDSNEMQLEKDNLYSAINRAQRHLYIFYPQKRETPSGEWSSREKSSLLAPTAEVTVPKLS